MKLHLYDRTGKIVLRYTTIAWARPDKDGMTFCYKDEYNRWQESRVAYPEHPAELMLSDMHAVTDKD